MTQETIELPSHPAVAESAKGWVAEEQEKIPVWEIGLAYHGCSEDASVVAQQRDMLDAFLERYGNEVEKWDLAPEIREVHNHAATVGALDFGRRLTVNRQPCRWAAYGRLISREQPKSWYVPEGVRIPLATG